MSSSGLSDTRDILKALNEIRGGRGAAAGTSSSDSSSDDDGAKTPPGSHTLRMSPSSREEAVPQWEQSPIPLPVPPLHCSPQQHQHQHPHQQVLASATGKSSALDTGGGRMVAEALSGAAQSSGMARSRSPLPPRSSTSPIAATRGASGGGGGGRGPNKEVEGIRGGGRRISSGESGSRTRSTPSPTGRGVSLMELIVPGSSSGGRRSRSSASPPTNGKSRGRNGTGKPGNDDENDDDDDDDDDDEVKVILAFDPTLLDAFPSVHSPPPVAPEPRCKPPYAIQSLLHAQASAVQSPPSPPPPQPSLDDSIGLPIYRPTGEYNLPPSVRPLSHFGPVNPRECFDDYSFWKGKEREKKEPNWLRTPPLHEPFVVSVAEQEGRAKEHKFVRCKYKPPPGRGFAVDESNFDDYSPHGSKRGGGGGGGGGGGASVERVGGSRGERTIDRPKESPGVRKVPAPTGRGATAAERRPGGVRTRGKEDWNSVAQFFYTAGPGK